MDIENRTMHFFVNSKEKERKKRKSNEIKSVRKRDEDNNLKKKMKKDLEGIGHGHHALRCFLSAKLDLPNDQRTVVFFFYVLWGYLFRCNTYVVSSV